MKKIHLITGNSIHQKINKNHSLFQLFFEKLTVDGFNFEGVSFNESLLKSCERIRSLEYLNESFLDFYKNTILFIRHFGVFSKLKTENIFYKILKINDDTPIESIFPIKTLDLKMHKHEEDVLKNEFSRSINSNKSSFEVFEVSIDELDSRFLEICNFFSELKK